MVNECIYPINIRLCLLIDESNTKKEKSKEQGAGKKKSKGAVQNKAGDSDFIRAKGVTAGQAKARTDHPKSNLI